MTVLPFSTLSFPIFAPLTATSCGLTSSSTSPASRLTRPPPSLSREFSSSRRATWARRTCSSASCEAELDDARRFLRLVDGEALLCAAGVLKLETMTGPGEVDAGAGAAARRDRRQGGSAGNEGAKTYARGCLRAQATRASGT